MESGKVIIFWSKKKKRICFIHEQYNGLLYYTPFKKRPTKNMFLKYIRNKNTYLSSEFYYSFDQHSAIFNDNINKNSMNRLIKIIGRSKENLWNMETEV